MSYQEGTCISSMVFIIEGAMSSKSLLNRMFFWTWSFRKEYIP